MMAAFDDYCPVTIVMIPAAVQAAIMLVELGARAAKIVTVAIIVAVASDPQGAQLFLDGFRSLKRSDVPVQLGLSGGKDSRLIAAALYAGVAQVAAGLHRTVLVVGGEKMTHLSTPRVSELIGRSIDPYERSYGATLPALAGLITRALLARHAAGLRAIAHGFAVVHGDHDHEKIRLETPLYDALYAWCQQEVSGGR